MNTGREAGPGLEAQPAVRPKPRHSRMRSMGSARFSETSPLQGRVGGLAARPRTPQENRHATIGGGDAKQCEANDTGGLRRIHLPRHSCIRD